VSPAPVPPHVGDFSSGHKAKLFQQDQVNRSYMRWEHQQPQPQTVRRGIEFIEANHDSDNWFLQIETFDPHEPHFAQEHYRTLYESEYAGPLFDWPFPKRVDESEEEILEARRNYAAMVSMCDAYLGRVMDTLDRLDLWDDTMLIVNTDHGYLLSEHQWWGKNIMPFYNEIAHIPLFIWDPRYWRRGERADALVQMIDMAPTLYSFFNVEPAPHMQGLDLREVLAGNERVAHESVLFGTFGGQINCCDGRYVYMRGPATHDNEPLFQYTVMPTHMVGSFSLQSLRQATLHHGDDFLQGARVLRVPEQGPFADDVRGLETMLFDLSTDPNQDHPLKDAEIEARMKDILIRGMVDSSAPPEQYERLGLTQPENHVSNGSVL
jgi:arylsulfatase A-like enzyme